MTPELTVLTLLALFQVVLYCIFSVAGQRQLSTRYALSSRDEGLQPTGKTGRLQRAMANHVESMVLFGMAALVVTFADKATDITAMASYAFLLLRLLYVPAYVFDWVPWRSLIWGLGLVATTLLLVLAVL